MDIEDIITQVFNVNGWTLTNEQLVFAVAELRTRGIIESHTEGTNK